MFKRSFRELVSERYSCRLFDGKPIAAEALRELRAFMDAMPAGDGPRFVVLASTPGDSASLKGLGTYGFIKGASAFIVGVGKRGASGQAVLIDFGKAMELVVLKATELGLGTCWLGGTFTRSGFAARAHLDKSAGEFIPAVIAMGNISTSVDTRSSGLRVRVGGATRKPSDALFFDADGRPLSPEAVGVWAPALEAVRWAPSASNKQPWRLYREGDTWHLRLARTPGYSGGLLRNLLRVADLQMNDMGIAMAHLEGVAHELGLPGKWTVRTPAPGGPGEYIATWA